MIGVRGGIGGRDGRIGAEMPGQIERQLHARRKFRKTLVDAELEIKRAILMPQHDRGRDRGIAGAQGHDLALTRLGERHGGAPHETGIAVVLHQRGAALAFPAAGFERQECLDRGRDLFRRSRHLEMHGAVLGQPMALAAQFLQLLGAQRVAQQRIGIARRIEAGADPGLQHARTQAAPAARLRQSPSWRRRPARRCAGSAHGRRLSAPAPTGSVTASFAMSRSSSGVPSVP